MDVCLSYVLSGNAPQYIPLVEDLRGRVYCRKSHKDYDGHRSVECKYIKSDNMIYIHAYMCGNV